MPFTGHYLYRGLGSLASVDFVTPVASVPAEQQELVLSGAGHAPRQSYTYVLRPVVDDLVTPDVSCVTTFITNAAGQWLGDVPASPQGLMLSVRFAAKVRLQWRYETPAGGAPPVDFAIRKGKALPLDMSVSPSSVVGYTRDGSYLLDIGPGAGTHVFALEARSAAGARSAPVIGGPIVVRLPHTTAPAARFDAVA